MPGFYTINNKGCLKVKSGGSGASLTDPLGTVHGGFADPNTLILPAMPQCGIPYASDTDLISFREPDLDNGQRVPKAFTNLLFPGETPATDPRLGLVPRWTGLSNLATFGFGINKLSQKSSFDTRTAWWTAFGNSSVGSAGNYFSTLTGTSSVIFDSSSTWIRLTSTAGSGTGIGFTSISQVFLWTWNPFIEIKFRTGSDVSNTNFWFQVFIGASASIQANTYIGAGGIATFGLRCLSATDTGFVPYYSDGTTVTPSSAIGTIAASTTYDLQIYASGSLGNFICIVDDGSSVSSGNIIIPISTAINSLDSIGFSVANNSGAGTRFVDMHSGLIIVTRGGI